MSTWKMGQSFSAHGHRVTVFSFERTGHQTPEFGDLETAHSDGGCQNTENLDALARVVESLQPDIIINQMPYEHAVTDVLVRTSEALGSCLLGCLRNTLFSVKNNIPGYLRSVAPAAATRLLDNAVGHRLALELHRRRHRDDLARILECYDRFVMFGPPNLGELRFFVRDFDPRRIALVPNSIPSVLDSPPAKERRLLWLGRLTDEQKRADLIPPLWERIQPALPGWHLDVVGDGPARQAVERACRHKGLEEISFHGQQVPDEFYRRSAVFLMTSAWEGFPNTLAEAQSYGAVPVLFDTFAVASWMVNDGVDAFLIPPFEIDAMASKVVDVASASTLVARRWQSAALDNARRFSIDRVGLLWEQLFSECIAERQPLEPGELATR